WSGSRLATSSVESVDLSSTRMTSSTTSVGIAETVASSVRAALRAGITTMTLAWSAEAGVACSATLRASVSMSVAGLLVFGRLGRSGRLRRRPERTACARFERPLLRLAAVRRTASDRVERGLHQVDRHWEHHRRILIAADLAERLEVPELQGGRVPADHVGGLGELRRGLGLSLGVDDLRAALALGLGLAGDRVLPRLGDLAALDLG